MQIQIRTDKNIPSDARLEEHVREAAQSALGRFGDRITRLEFHLADENGSKEGGDIRCSIEARLAGLPPVGASHSAPRAKEAITGALDKVAGVIGTQVGKEHDKRREN